MVGLEKDKLGMTEGKRRIERPIFVLMDRGKEMTWMWLLELIYEMHIGQEVHKLWLQLSEGNWLITNCPFCHRSMNNIPLKVVLA